MLLLPVWVQGTRGTSGAATGQEGQEADRVANTHERFWEHAGAVKAVKAQGAGEFTLSLVGQQRQALPGFFKASEAQEILFKVNNEDQGNEEEAAQTPL